MLKILTAGYKDIKVKVYIDRIPDLKHPKSILIGGGNLAVKYDRYLQEKAFDNVSLLNKLAQIYKLSLKEEGVALVCECKIGRKDNRQAHSDVIRAFIIEHQETFKNLLPYLFTNELFIPKTQEELDKDLSLCSEKSKEVLLRNYETAKLLFEPGPVQGEVQLSEEDKQQIHKLIQDQQKESSGNEVVPTEGFKCSEFAAVSSNAQLASELETKIEDGDTSMLNDPLYVDEEIKHYADFSSLPDPKLSEGQTAIVDILKYTPVVETKVNKDDEDTKGLELTSS